MGFDKQAIRWMRNIQSWWNSTQNGFTKEFPSQITERKPTVMTNRSNAVRLSFRIDKIVFFYCNNEMADATMIPLCLFTILFLLFFSHQNL